MRDTQDLVPIIAASAITCIDIPIGLPKDEERACDLKAKSLLGRYHSRVFMTPPRAVVEQTDYEEANARSREIVSKGLSKQAWNILPKVRAIDELLRASPQLGSRVNECHPEVALWGITRRVIESKKATNKGHAERIEILEEVLHDPRAMFDHSREMFKRTDVKDDDIVDAMICAATASGLETQCLYDLIEGDPRDEYGLEMNMVYHTP